MKDQIQVNTTPSGPIGRVVTRIGTCVCVLLQILALQVASQPAAKETKYSVRHFTSDNGLPQNTVRAITQDQEGFIWLATDMGLVRFDGQSFISFDQKKLGLESRSFLSFTRDIEGHQGRLYALGRKLTHIRIDGGTATLDKNPLENRIYKIFKPNGRPYDVSYMLGLPDRWKKDWLPSNCLFLLPNSNGDFYVWSKGGQIDLYLNWKIQKTYATPLLSPIGLFRIGKNLYYDDESGNIRLMASTFDVTSRRITMVAAPGESGKPDLNESYTLYADDFSGKGFIYQKRKLYLLLEQAPGTFLTRVLLEDFDFERNGVTSIFHDSKLQRLYLGTINEGLLIFDFEVFEALGIQTVDPGLNVFYAITALSDSTIITPSFYRLGKGKNGQSISDTLPRPIKKTVNRYTILKSRNGDIWFVGYGWSNRWLYRFEQNSQKLKGLWDLKSDIEYIYEDDIGRIWLGMKSQGLKYINPDEDQAPIHSFTKKIGNISYILQEGKDTLWVATYNGLFKVNLSRNTIAEVPHTSQYYIRSLLVGHAGELWFTTYEHGIFLLKNGKLTRFPLDKDHFLAHAHCIASDQNGFFWVPTNQGLYRILKQDLLDYANHLDSTRLYYHRYTKQSGFRTNEFNGGCQPCAVRLGNGYMSMPSINGLVFFKPEQIPVDTPHAKIFIDRVEANSGNVPVNGSKIQLAGVSDLRVFFSSPYLAERQNQQLYYTISEEDRPSSTQTWFPIEQEQHFISLNNLSSGTYTLKIRKNTGFGPNSVQLTTLTIVVPYPWYDTWPFKLVVIILVLVAIYFYFKNRLKKADQLNRALESRVSEKTRNLQDTLSVLKESEQELLRQTRLQMHLIASISHDIRSPLRSIEFASGKVRGLLQEGELELVGAIGASVNESSGRVLLLLENMLSYVKSQMSGASVAHDTFVVKNLVDEIAVIFNTSFKVQENKFVNNIPQTILLKSNRQLLKIILHNLIDNANKYTSGGSVIVTASQKNEVVRLLVTDTGPGLPEAVLNWFNSGDDTIYPQSPDNAPEMHGIGLVIVKELAGMLNARIGATSISGAAFSIEFWNT